MFKREPKSLNTGQNANLCPNDSPFRQQKLSGWIPVMTPTNTLPIFFIIGSIFIPLGIILLLSSINIIEHSIDYTRCMQDASDEFQSVNGIFEWKRDLKTKTCHLRGNIEEMPGPVFVYFRLTNFYQNNRYYVNSVSHNQLRGIAVPYNDLKASCNKIYNNDVEKKIIYPCGLIADSFFSDTLQSVAVNGKHNFVSQKNISWQSEDALYGKTQYKLEEIAPPESWKGRIDLPFLDLDTNEYVELPDFTSNEFFHNWMRPAAFPNFLKLYGRVDDGLPSGKLNLEIHSIYDVLRFNGTKSIVITTGSWIGGKNPFLGIMYIVMGGICLMTGFGFLVKHLLRPRAVGDSSLVSWARNP